MTKTWFTAKTVHDQKYMSGGTLCPTIEIAIQDPNVSYPSTARQSLYFGGGSTIPKTLFDILSGTDQFDAEQKFHYPMEEQSDASMLFRQNTVETSVGLLVMVISLLLTPSLRCFLSIVTSLRHA